MAPLVGGVSLPCVFPPDQSGSHAERPEGSRGRRWEDKRANHGDTEGTEGEADGWTNGWMDEWKGDASRKHQVPSSQHHPQIAQISQMGERRTARRGSCCLHWDFLQSKGTNEV